MQQGEKGRTEETEAEGRGGGKWTEEETAPWNWFRSMDHWKQSSLLNSPLGPPRGYKGILRDDLPRSASAAARFEQVDPSKRDANR